jgi:signal transduction histidine kinase
MQSETHTVIRDRVAPRIDTRVVLYAYGAVAIAVGLTITGTGLRGIPGMPQPYASLIYIGGMVMVAAGCAACGLSINDDPIGRQRSTRWFAAGHVLLGLFAWMQWTVYWRSQGFPLLVALAPLLTGLALLAVAMPARLGADDRSTVALRIRSRYDEHIRQIARREERARLARDLHDAVKQQLFVIQTAAATVQTRFDDDRNGAREALEQVRSAAREATTEMAALLDELQAAPMENTGLIEALKKQCEALALRTGADVRFEPGTLPPAGSLRPGTHEAIYRVAQEALANVARHARAARVVVALQWKAMHVVLRVWDNGTGIATNLAPTGMGITNMRERAAEIGGHLSITPGSPGTEVVLSVPTMHPAVRGAWYAAGMFALVALSTAVFYALRGPSADRATSLLSLLVYAAWVAGACSVAYRKVWKEKTR